jgi:hypothetical protein
MAIRLVIVQPCSLPAYEPFRFVGEDARTGNWLAYPASRCLYVLRVQSRITQCVVLQAEIKLFVATVT